jgi:hypothetical protein
MFVDYTFNIIRCYNFKWSSVVYHFHTRPNPSSFHDSHSHYVQAETFQKYILYPDRIPE